MAYQDQRSRNKVAIPGPALIRGNTPGRQISPNNSYNSLASLGIYPAFATYSQGYNQFVPSPPNYSRTFSDDTRQAQIPQYVYGPPPTQKAPPVHSFDNSSKRSKSKFALELPLPNNSTSHRQGYYVGNPRVEDYYDGSYLTSRNPCSSQYDNWQQPVSSPRYAPSSPSIRPLTSQYDAATVSKSRMLPCRTFISTGCCPYGARCVFLHDPRIACSTAWRVDKVIKCKIYIASLHVKFFIYDLFLATEAQRGLDHRFLLLDTS